MFIYLIFIHFNPLFLVFIYFYLFFFSFFLFFLFHFISFSTPNTNNLFKLNSTISQPFATQTFFFFLNFFLLSSGYKYSFIPSLFTMSFIFFNNNLLFSLPTPLCILISSCLPLYHQLHPTPPSATSPFCPWTMLPSLTRPRH